jgi:hypothetical protein
MASRLLAFPPSRADNTPVVPAMFRPSQPVRISRVDDEVESAEVDFLPSVTETQPLFMLPCSITHLATSCYISP